MLLGDDYSLDINRFPHLGNLEAVAGSHAEAKVYTEGNAVCKRTV